MSALDDDLLPCPHCGSPAKSYHRPDATGWQNTDWICCDSDDDGVEPNCGAQTCLHSSREAAVAAWNRRTSSGYTIVRKEEVRDEDYDDEGKAALSALEATPPAPVTSMLSNLLAVIHRDGGHYEAEHGTDKACADAETVVARLHATPPAPAGQPVTLTYKNWRGEVAERTITPKRVWFGSTDWHPEPQWLLTAFDAEKQADRDFALKDFGATPPAPKVTGAMVEAALKSLHENPVSWESRSAIRAAITAAQEAGKP